jgi:hypothetical protein
MPRIVDAVKETLKYERTAKPATVSAPATSLEARLVEQAPATVVPPPAPVVEVTPIIAKPASLPAKRCPFCAEEILLDAKKCKHCGEIVDVALRAAEEAKSLAVRSHSAGNVLTNTVIVNTSVSGAIRRWNRAVAMLLSLILPGLGQIYKGQFLNGVIWFVVVGGGYCALLAPGIVLHCCCVLGAGMGDPTR